MRTSVRARKCTTQYRPIVHFHRRRPGWATTSVATDLLQNICIRVSCVTKAQLVVYFEGYMGGGLHRLKTQRTEVREHDFAGIVVRGAQGGRLQEVGIRKQLHLELARLIYLSSAKCHCTRAGCVYPPPIHLSGPMPQPSKSTVRIITSGPRDTGRRYASGMCCGRPDQGPWGVPRLVVFVDDLLANSSATW